MKSWSPDSWRDYPAKQQPNYADETLASQVVSEIAAMPPLVAVGEIESLKKKLAAAADGKQFLLQGGDCAERFVDCRPAPIMNKLKILLQMSVVLSYGARKPVVRVGRIAGQFAKPRSAPTEMVSGVEMMSYRGDNINSFEPDEKSRQPDPRRLMKSYQHSSITLNYIRALIKGGFADLHHAEHWNLSAFATSEQKNKYHQIVDNILDAITFMESFGGIRQEALGDIDFYTSHEGLLLAYEQALTRSEEGRYYNLGAHMLWIGDRTRQLDGAHVEYYRGILNPVGVKVGPSAEPKEVVKLIERINPQKDPGRIVLITRYGADRVRAGLSPLVKAVMDSGQKVVWSCDPMHGNTEKSDGGIKTRRFDAILKELSEAFEVHETEGSHLGGVHFELTGEDVTECVGGAAGIAPKDLARNYETYCDPRLNYSQSLEMAFLISSNLM